jgi:hypothetical protein
MAGLQEINSKMIVPTATTSPACIHFPKSGHFDSMMATMFSTYMTISDLFISCTYDE